MIRIAAAALVAALISFPAAAQNKGKSETAPGHSGATPSQAGTAPSSAPGYLAKDDPTKTGKDYAPGQAQSGTPNPNKPTNPGKK